MIVLILVTITIVVCLFTLKITIISNNEGRRYSFHLAADLTNGGGDKYQNIAPVVAKETTTHEKSFPTKQPRVAIIVAGTLQRFMFRNVIDKLIRPLVKKSAKVDYYLSLTTSAGTPYRAGGGKTSYLNHIEKVDPRLVPVKATASEAVELPHHGNNTMWHPMAMEEFIRSQIARAGASIGELLIQEKIDIDSEPMLRARREKAMRKHPEEDADLRFPIFDIRSKEIENRTANANRNLLRLHLAVERLWASLVKWEDEEGFEYDYVLFLRDDSLWLSKFDLSAFESIASEEKDVDIFIPSCDAREPPMDSHELNDHAIISRRRSADVFGRYYSILLNGHHDHDRDREWNMYRKKKMEWKEEDSRNKNEDHIGDDNHVVDIVDACMSTLPITMTTSPRKRAVGIASSSSSSSHGGVNVDVSRLVRGCNSEMLLKWVIDVHNIKVKKVGQGVIPLEGDFLKCSSMW
eukprot:CAMPEP_0176482562 /NCGR_PEP_ID=MMETSP0200_2-20121128/3443_1 /TAXON_ID=947934 /ORGANISM="Chaetoceros sp., Strain GSL56" /LENGTH=463 /DNA_ID=CAMNT_0017878889 /DNA_START=329 /DNA_END=1717 /DNA_ORIENTATION=+